MPPVDPVIGRLAVLEAARRAKAAATLDFKPLCFPQQLAFVLDEAKFVLACTSRRAGKSEGVALKLIRWAQSRSNVQVPYVTVTRPMAKRIMWPKLKEWDRRLQLGGHFNNALLEYTLPNGSVIFLGSAETDDEIEKLRGLALVGACLDETQAFKPGILKTLIEDIIMPALTDYDGQLLLTGTPSAACAGFFYAAATGKAPGFSVHHWTMFDNPHMRNPRKQLDRYLRLRGLSESDPKIQREWFGRWVRDSERSVFHLELSVLADALPEADDWSYVLGCDFGYRDASAFVVLAYSIDRGEVYAVEAFERTKLLTGDAAEVVKHLYDRYDPEHLVGDMGGLGKPYAEEIIQRYGLPMVAAEKAHKVGAIEDLNADLRGGRARVLSTCSELWEQARALEWNYDKVLRKKGIEADADDEVRHVVRADLAISGSTPDHLCDAWLYAYRACYQYLHQAVAPDDLNPGMSREELEMEEALEARLRRPVSTLSEERLPDDAQGLWDPYSWR